MTYPATTYAEGVELTITSGNQLHEIINGDATEEINTESGMVPSVRKALADSMLFKPAIAWAEGSVESDPFQTRLYGEGIYWAPAASNETPISMGTNPNIDGNWFLAPVTGGETISRNTNLLSNHNFIIQSPDDITHPSVTPTDYVTGTQVFSGVFVGDDIVGLTYIDGRVSWTSGTLYFSVPNSGALEYVDETDFVASVADFDGKPRTRGVYYALVGDEYRVTVGVDALEDESANETLLGSVKFEQGSVATRHESKSLFDIYGHPNMGIYNIKAFGAVGDGLTIDDDAINSTNTACQATGGILTIPTGEFLVAQEHTFNTRVECHGELLIDNSVPNDFIAVTLERDSRSYPWQSVITGLRVKAVGKQATNVIGILNISSGSEMRDCRAVGCGINIAVCTFTVTLTNCVGYDGGKNLAIARGDNYSGTISECNDVKIIGGNYNTALYYTLSIGDDYIYPDDSTGNPQGVQLLIQGAAFDGNQVWVRSVFDVKFDTCYWENATTQNRLVTVGDNSHSTTTRLVTFDNCYQSNASYGIYATRNTDAIEIRPCHFTGINKCRIYKEDGGNGAITVRKQSGIGNTGPLVHTGAPFNALGDIEFTLFTIDSDNLANGTQNVDVASLPNSIYSTCLAIEDKGTWLSNHSGGRVYISPESATGTWSGTEFTFSVFSDAYKFNGGDAITNGNGFIRYMDYDNGKAVCSISGSGDLQQKEVAWHKRLTGFQVPTSGDYLRGDIVFNNYLANASVFAWSCSTSGNPGVWRVVSST